MINIESTLKIIKRFWQYSNTCKMSGCAKIIKKKIYIYIYLQLILQYGLASAKLAVISR